VSCKISATLSTAATLIPHWIWTAQCLIKNNALKEGRTIADREPESSLMCALALLLLIHLAIAAGDAPDPCAPLRAQNTELAAQLLARDAELSRLRSELAAARSTAEASKQKGSSIGTGVARGLETDAGVPASNRRREGNGSAKALMLPMCAMLRSSPWH
jgi:hypothetical protein